MVIVTRVSISLTISPCSGGITPLIEPLHLSHLSPPHEHQLTEAKKAEVPRHGSLQLPLLYEQWWLGIFEWGKATG